MKNPRNKRAHEQTSKRANKTRKLIWPCFSESVQITGPALQAVTAISRGDMRSAINLLQAAALSNSFNVSAVAVDKKQKVQL